MAQKIKKNLMLVDFKKLNIAEIKYTETKIKVNTEKYFYLLSEDSKSLYLVRKRFISKLFSSYKLNVTTFNVLAELSSTKLTIEPAGFIDNVYFIDEDKYFIFSDKHIIVDSSDLFISGYFEVSDELIELKKDNDSKFIGLVDDSTKYAYKIRINDDVYIKINTSYLNLKVGSKLKLYGKFKKNDDFYVHTRYLESNEINFEEQVNSLEVNYLMPVFPYILNIRDFSDINENDSKFDISGFKIVYENKEKEKVVNVEGIQVLEAKDNLEQEEKLFWTFNKILLIGIAIFVTYLVIS